MAPGIPRRKTMKAFAFVLAAVLAAHVQAADLDVQMSCPSSGGDSIVTQASIITLPDTCVFLQLSVEYDTTEVVYLDSWGINGATVTFDHVFSPLPEYQEEGNGHVMIQAQGSITSTGAYVEILWGKVVTGAHDLHFNDSEVSGGTAATHALTQWGNPPDGELHQEISENMTSYDGCVTFTGGGHGGGDLDRRKPYLPRTWGGIKGLYQ